MARDRWPGAPSGILCPCLPRTPPRPLPLDEGDLGPSLGPTWQLPDVPDSVLSPFSGDPPEWWQWVPIHPAPYGGGEHGGGFHYLVDLAPAEMLSYYREALRQAGREEPMGEIGGGGYSAP